MEEMASKKFWEIPELLEMLLPHLDSASILELAKAHRPTIQILQCGSNWDKLIQRTSPYSARKSLGAVYLKGNSDSSWLTKNLEAKKAELLPLIKMLAMMEEPQDCLVNLLDLICTRFPIGESGRPLRYVKAANGKTVPVPEAVKVTCPNHTSHKVSSLGFLLLEEVEGALGSAEQSVQWLGVAELEGILLSSLGARMRRQQLGARIKMELIDILCSNPQQAEDVLVIMKNCKRLIHFRQLHVFEDGASAEAWAALAKAVELHPGKCSMSATRKALLAGRREDLKVLWEAVRFVEVFYSDALIYEYDGDVFIEKEEGWGRLEQVLDMSEDQFKAEAQDVEESEEEEEEEEEEEIV